jgi:hypothetical protein
MVARTQPARGLLIVMFARDGELPQEIFANDGNHAADIAVMMIQAKRALLPGDTLTVRRADDILPVAEPEPSRASHYS